MRGGDDEEDENAMEGWGKEEELMRDGGAQEEAQEEAQGGVEEVEESAAMDTDEEEPAHVGQWDGGDKEEEGGNEKQEVEDNKDEKDEDEEIEEENQESSEGPKAKRGKKAAAPKGKKAAAPKAARGKKADKEKATPKSTAVSKKKEAKQAASSGEAAAKAEAKPAKIVLSKLSKSDLKTEQETRQRVREAAAATIGYAYHRSRLPDLPPSSIPDKITNPDLAPLVSVGVIKTFKNIDKPTMTCIGSRVSGLMPPKTGEALNGVSVQGLKHAREVSGAMQVHGLLRNNRVGLHP